MNKVTEVFRTIYLGVILSSNERFQVEKGMGEI
jgi:hypothetical protein